MRPERWCVNDREGRNVAAGTTHIENDTVLNVAQLLKENVGSKRTYAISLDSLSLDESITARDISAQLKLTRIADGILVTGSLNGVARLECVRCLEEFDTSYGGEVEAQFRPTIDISSGAPVEFVDDGETFEIDESHQLDLAEMLRQVSILTLPIRPVCGDDCPGFVSEFRGGDEPPSEEAGDERLAVLEQLLEDSREER
jgi:uncharacterized protein